MKKPIPYDKLLSDIGHTIVSARRNVAVFIDTEHLRAYWQIGKHIVEYEQHGSVRADYGSALLSQLSRDLRVKHGKGFSKSNVYLMRQFYRTYPIFQTVSGKLSWSKVAELLGVADNLARGFYEKQCIGENWSVRELKRQIDSGLFQRTALSKKPDQVIALSKNGHTIKDEKDVFKDPYVLEFLDLPEEIAYTETVLEKRIIDNMQMFLLELGKGFSFVGRQYRITLNNRHHRVDLVFYHRILKCFVLIDLKTGRVKHEDIGQMNMYLNYFKEEESSEGDNEPIGLVLASDKDEIMVHYATGGMTRKVFVSRYQTYLPDKKLLENKLKAIVGADNAVGKT